LNLYIIPPDFNLAQVKLIQNGRIHVPGCRLKAYQLNLDTDSKDKKVGLKKVKNKKKVCTKKVRLDDLFDDVQISAVSMNSRNFTLEASYNWWTEDPDFQIFQGEITADPVGVIVP